ncbi:MAG: hypothetical protein QGI78_09080, partial [Phycisphaerales bacterium]|nr:hypothetical protein [Phycisphaerales bacterium]
MAILTSCALNLMPFCDRGSFEQICGDVLVGEQKSVAFAIYDLYVDQVQSITEPDAVSKEKLAALYLRGFGDSISILGEEQVWSKAGNAIVRSCLLQSRNISNPWPETVWIDLSTI